MRSICRVSGKLFCITAGMIWIGNPRPNNASRTRSFSSSVTDGPSPLVPKGTMPRTPISASQET
jgi:hypothetical protein